MDCELVVPVMKEGQDLGLTCYYDENSFLKYGVGMRDGNLGILLEEYVGDGYRLQKFEPLDFQPFVLKLKIETRFLERKFYYRVRDTWIYSGSVSRTEYLCSEGLQKGKRFTGAMAGIYVHGDFTGVFTAFVSN